MIRYGIIRSPYPDKLQARAIELLRLVEHGGLKADGLMEILSKEFPRNKRLKGDKLSIRVVRIWAKKRPDLPEIMNGEIQRIRSFSEVAEKETIHEMSRLAMNEVTVSLINSMVEGESIPKRNQEAKNKPP